MATDKCSRKVTDCSKCDRNDNSTLTFHQLSKGKHIPAFKCTLNTMVFVMHGSLLVNSKEYAGTILEEDQFIFQAIGSKVEVLAMIDTEYILYQFSEPLVVCNPRKEAFIEMTHDGPLINTPLSIIKPLRHYLDGLMYYLMDSMLCKEFIMAKRVELAYILTSYYPIHELLTILRPLSEYSNSFQHFVINNYWKVKNVEEFAHLGGYSVTTFRRIFKNVFKEPAYEWMLKKKQASILEELTSGKMTISDICYQYEFTSLSHFSNFCKTCFGDSPRTIRIKAKEEMKKKLTEELLQSN